jgi:hypothetical protein
LLLIITLASPYLEFTRTQLDMRRKVEILKYENNATNTKTNNFTKNQQWSMLVNGTMKNAPQIKIQEDQICPSNDYLPKLSSDSDVPGKVIVLQLDPSVPLYNYVKNESYPQNGNDNV